MIRQPQEVSAVVLYFTHLIWKVGYSLHWPDRLWRGVFFFVFVLIQIIAYKKIKVSGARDWVTKYSFENTNDMKAIFVDDVRACLNPDTNWLYRGNC